MKKSSRKPVAVSMAIGSVVVASVLSLGGCSSSRSARDADYATAPDEPRRDADTARGENARAAGLIDAGKYDEAETALKSALTSDITFGPAHNNLGKVYFQQRKYYLAAWEFQYAMKLMPHRPEPANNLGLVFEAVGKLNDAVDWYGRALKMEPDNPEFIGNAARARFRRGDRDADLSDLLAQLVLKDTRAEWVRWAREQLALMRPTASN